MRYLFIVLFCDRIYECKKFYEVCGFSFAVHRDGSWPEYFIGSNNLGLEIQLHYSWVPNDHMQFGFLTDDIDDLKVRLVNQKVDFEDSLWRDIPCVSLKDPEGRRVKIMHKDLLF